MQLENLSIGALEKMIPLLKEREKLQKRLEEVDAQIGQLKGKDKPVSGGRGKAKKKAKKATRRTRSKRRNLKEEIPAILKKAGKNGLRAVDIAEQLKLPANNVYTWFYTTGKKLKPIKQVNNRYVWNE